MKRKNILEVCCFLIFFLFIYVALNKIIYYETFVEDLGRQPILEPRKYFLSILIPASEILFAILIISERGRRVGLIGAVVLMSFFTLYVIYVMSFNSYWPCACGG
ncbi:MauE/DoxX family redox-associated membrane protein [Chitinophaga sedimenti]|uniref:MauE/DoxX family redox-associated membrane protein n=1 Tax=Chitinophaga sedimenti TaxID=2033606 RepID=UPI003557CE33